MININNYISEKLHIGKDYEVKLTLDDFLQIFKDEDNLYVETKKEYLRGGKNAICCTLMKYKSKTPGVPTYPNLEIRLFDDYFQPATPEADEFEIYTINANGDKLKVDNKFHLKNESKHMIIYDEHNAKLIIDFFKNAKD